MTEYEMIMIVISLIELIIQVIATTICTLTFVVVLLKYINKKK